jgi:ubiquinol-cytochrome c reductase iron-sulfur subunit
MSSSRPVSAMKAIVGRLVGRLVGLVRRPGVVPVLAGGGLLGLAAVGAVLGVEGRYVAALGAIGLAVAGAGLVVVAQHLAPGEPDVEVRDVHGPDLRRRRLIAVAGGALAAVATAGVLVPAGWRSADAERRLRRTAWGPGRRLVTPDGMPVAADQLEQGGALTVFPEGAVGQADAQVLLAKVDVRQVRLRPGRDGWAPDGNVAYSRLCTHMACPLSLYQQRNEVLVCPCHQAVFDLLDGGRPVQGPAKRALPQLPLAVDDDGFLTSTGDFSDAPGTGFWGRPS